MSFYFTFYWVDMLGQRKTLTAKHDSNMHEEIIKWIEINDQFPETFLSYFQKFLRSKTIWCLNSVGFDVESQVLLLEPYFGAIVRNHKSPLLSCTFEELKEFLSSESQTRWYWLFVNSFAKHLERVFNYVDEERKDCQLTRELNILFHFE